VVRWWLVTTVLWATISILAGLAVEELLVGVGTALLLDARERRRACQGQTAAIDTPGAWHL